MEVGALGEGKDTEIWIQRGENGWKDAGMEEGALGRGKGHRDLDTERMKRGDGRSGQGEDVDGGEGKEKRKAMAKMGKVGKEREGG